MLSPIQVALNCSGNAKEKEVMGNRVPLWFGAVVRLDAGHSFDSGGHLRCSRVYLKTWPLGLVHFLRVGICLVGRGQMSKAAGLLLEPVLLTQTIRG